MTTHDPGTGERDFDTLRAIKEYRGQVDGKDLMFGVWARSSDAGRHPPRRRGPRPGLSRRSRSDGADSASIDRLADRTDRTSSTQPIDPSAINGEIRTAAVTPARSN